MDKFIALVKDLNIQWWKKFAEILENRNLDFKLIDIEKNDWLSQIGNIKYVIWRPNLSEPYLRQAREKLYILENILNKKVYPNQKTIWHYDNKNAEYYLAKIAGIKMPQSFISYSYEDSLDYIKNCKYPLVSKAAGGAGSRNVRLLKNLWEAKNELDYLFNRNLKNKLNRKILSKFGIMHTKYDFQKNYVNYQEFIPNNIRDFRITTIGGKYAFAFYRKNRDKDFRASGSGKIDHNPEGHDLNAIKYFLSISRKNHFDTMCYDILYKEKDFVTTEFSYIFVDEPIYNCTGYYELKNGELEFIKGHIWPQELIIEYLLENWGLCNE